MISARLPTLAGTRAHINSESNALHPFPLGYLVGLPLPRSAAPQPLVGKIYTHVKTKVSSIT